MHKIAKYTTYEYSLLRAPTSLYQNLFPRYFYINRVRSPPFKGCRLVCDVAMCTRSLFSAPPKKLTTLSGDKHHIFSTKYEPEFLRLTTWWRYDTKIRSARTYVPLLSFLFPSQFIGG